MSTDVTKVQVFRATKIRTSLKGDGSWIRGSTDPNESLDKLRKPEIPKKPDNLTSPVTSPTHLAKTPLTSELKRLENTGESRPLSTRQNSYVLSAAKKFESVTPPVSPSVKKTQSNPVTRFEETSANVNAPAESMSEPAVKTTVANKEVLSVLAVDPPKDEVGAVDSNAPVEDHNGASSSELEKDQSPKAEAKHTAKVPVGLENISIEENTAKPTSESKPANKSQTGQLVQASVEPVLQEGEPEMAEHDQEPLDVEFKEPFEAKEEPTLAPVKDEAVGSSGVKTVTPMLTETEMNSSHVFELAADAATEPAVHAVVVHVESSESLAAECVPVEPAETPKPIVKTVEEADTEAVIDAAHKVTVADDIVEATAEPIVEAIDKAAVEVAVKTAAAEDVEPTAEVIVESVVQAAVKTAAAQDIIQPASEGAIDQTDKAAVDDAVKTAAAADDVQPVDEVIYEAEEEPVVGDVVKDAVKTAAAADDVIQPIVEPIVDAVDDTVVENVVKDALTTAAAQDFVQPSAKPIIEAVDQTVVIKPVAEAIIQAAIESEMKPVEEHVGEAMDAPSIQADKKVMVGIDPAVEVKEPAAEVVSETVESTSQSTPCSMESQPNQQAETNSKANSQDNVTELQTIQTQRQTSDGRAICSFCDQTIDGNIKITISEPPMYSHPECFKCCICTKALGDMLTTMFLHSQMVHCDNCFDKTL